MKNIKRIIAVIVAALFTLSLGINAFALEEDGPVTGTPIGDKTVQEFYAWERATYYLTEEEPLWDYDPETYKYTDENGTTWIYWPGGKINWIISNENDMWRYRIYDDGTLFVSGGAGNKNIVVPATLDGKKVKTVSLVGDENTLSVEFSEGIEEVGVYALKNRYNLQRVVIPESVKSICVEALTNAGMKNNGVDIYYCGTEQQWNDIIVWNQSNWGDLESWAVTGFNWQAEPFTHGSAASDVESITFNANPDELEDIVPEETPEPTPSVWENIISRITAVITSVVKFFTSFGELFRIVIM